MNRSDFVVGYIKKGSNDDTLICLACKIYKGHPTNGLCPMMGCGHDIFNNENHIPLVTQKECNWTKCPKASCNDCVMFLKFGVRRK